MAKEGASGSAPWMLWQKDVQAPSSKARTVGIAIRLTITVTGLITSWCGKSRVQHRFRGSPPLISATPMPLCGGAARTNIQ